VIGGYLATRAWNAPFLMYAFTLPVAGLVLLAFDDSETAPSSNDRGYIREALGLIPTRQALTLYGIMFVSFTLLFDGLYTALPFYLADAFGFTSTTVGLVTSTVLLVTAVVSTQNGNWLQELRRRLCSPPALSCTHSALSASPSQVLPRF